MLNAKPWQLTLTEMNRLIETAQANANSRRIVFIVFFDTSGWARVEPRHNLNVEPIYTAYPDDTSG